MTIQQLIDNITQGKLETSEQKTRVDSWRSWYNGYVRNFHDHQVYNGTNYVTERMHSLNMGKKVCEDWADLLYNERCIITTDSEDANDKLDKAEEDVNFEVQINHGTELGMALGTVGYVYTLDKESKEVTLEYVTADQVFPITVANGRVTECAFYSILTQKGKKVAYLTIHQKQGSTYVIENALYSYENNQIGEQLDYWVFNTRSQHQWFAVFEPNLVNNFDMTSPYGISVFANATEELKEIDNQFDAIDNEISIGRMRIIVATEALNYDENGNSHPIFDPKDTAFQKLSKDTNENTLIETIAPTLRTEQQIAALNNSLRHLSAKVGMGANHYAYDSVTGGLKTATEVISNNAPLYRRLKKHEKNLYECVRTLIIALADIYTLHLGIPIHFDELSIQFDDSIIQDKDTERKKDITDVNMAVMSKVEYRMKWYGEDEETAKKKVEEAQEYLPEGGDEGDF